MCIINTLHWLRIPCYGSCMNSQYMDLDSIKACRAAQTNLTAAKRWPNLKFSHQIIYSNLYLLHKQKWFWLHDFEDVYKLITKHLLKSDEWSTRTKQMMALSWLKEKIVWQCTKGIGDGSKSTLPKHKQDKSKPNNLGKHLNLIICKSILGSLFEKFSSPDMHGYTADQKKKKKICMVTLTLTYVYPVTEKLTPWQNICMLYSSQGAFLLKKGKNPDKLFKQKSTS